MGKQKIKRIADFLEKMAVGSALVAIFQNSKLAVGLAILFFVLSLLLTKEVQI